MEKEEERPGRDMETEREGGRATDRDTRENSNCLFMVEDKRGRGERERYFITQG